MREGRVRHPVAPEPDSYTMRSKPDWSEWTVADLKAEAARRGLSILSKTRKADIVAALEQTG